MGPCAFSVHFPANSNKRWLEIKQAGQAPPVVQALLQGAQGDGGGNVAQDVDHDDLQRHREGPQPRRDAPEHDRCVGPLLQRRCAPSRFARSAEQD